MLTLPHSKCGFLNINAFYTFKKKIFFMIWHIYLYRKLSKFIEYKNIQLKFQVLRTLRYNLKIR